MTNKNSKNKILPRHFVPMEEGTKLTGIRENLFQDRYSMKDDDGEAMEKYPEQMWRRVSWALAQSEKTGKLKKKWEKEFYAAMKNFVFCPAGRFLTSAGTGNDTTMINCFVIPSPEDTREGIIETLKHVTQISARGGGVGFNLSTLRPRGSYLKAINGTSSGSVSWSNIYSVAAHDIIQQGGTRRGALMMMLWDWHPDIEEFITVKKEKSKILGANLSVCVSDDFMKALEKGEDWDLKFPDTDHTKYRSEWRGDIREWEEKGYPVKVYKSMPASELWDLITESAWESAEPGVVFMDRYNAMNNTWYFEKNIATNPCGEQGLPAWGVCNLSSINLSNLVKDGEFDFDRFKKVIRVGVRFLDNAVDGEKYLYDEIEKTQQAERRIGLGTLGLADALIKLKIRYGSDESKKLIKKIYKTLRDESYKYSIELAKEKGPFPKFVKTKYLKSGFAKELPQEIRAGIKKHGIRNALLNTQAPTGKISLLAGASSGIEPVFSFSYTQKDRLGERKVYHKLYKDWIDENGEDDIPDYFVVADDLTPQEHVEIQALIQKYTDSSISKTVNAPKSHTIEDVDVLYRLAYRKGCKGISYMREGSREATLVRNKEKEEEKEKKTNGIFQKPSWERPEVITGSTYKLKTPVGTAYITINKDEEQRPIEMFINIGRAGSDIQAMAEALGRLISKSLKINTYMSPQERAMMIIDQLKGIGGTRPVGFGQNKVRSLPDAIAKALIQDMGLEKVKPQFYLNGNGQSLNDNGEKKGEIQHQLYLMEQKSELIKSADICPTCGNASLVHEMGCKTCYGCGYSEC